MATYYAHGKRIQHQSSLLNDSIIPLDIYNSTYPYKAELIDLMERFLVLQENLLNDPKKRNIESIRFYLVLQSPPSQNTFNTFCNIISKLGYRLYSINTNNKYRICIIPCNMKIYKELYNIYSPILLELKMKYLRP